MEGGASLLGRQMRHDGSAHLPQGQGPTCNLFDFHTQEETPVEIPTGIQALIIDTKLRRQLQNSEYNLRREECIQACQKIGVRSIRKHSILDRQE